MNKQVTSHCVAVSAAIALAMAASSAQAAVASFSFAGVVTARTGAPFGIVAPVGAQVTGTIAYEPTFPVNADNGVSASIQSPPSGMTVSVGATTLRSANYNSFQMLNDAFGPVDNINGFFTPIFVNDILRSDFSSISFSLTDFTLNAMSGTNLPTVLDYSLFAQRQGSIFDAASGGSIAFSLGASPVPIPSSMGLVGGGLIAIARYRRRGGIQRPMGARG